jgi:hypothetical protein
MKDIPKVINLFLLYFYFVRFICTDNILKNHRKQKTRVCRDTNPRYNKTNKY